MRWVPHKTADSSQISNKQIRGRLAVFKWTYNPGWSEVGAGILTIPSTKGESKATIRIDESTLAGNTIGTEVDSSGGLETLPFADEDSAGTVSASITVSTDRSIVDGNDGYGIGGTPLGVGVPANTLKVPVTNSYVYGHTSGNFEPEMYPTAPPSNYQTDPELTGDHAPDACSPVFDLMVCKGFTTMCADESECPAGPPQVPCVTGVGFHGNPDVWADSLIDGLDILDLAVSFYATDAPDPRFSEASDLDHSGVVDGEDLSYMGSQFGQVCLP